MKRLTLIPFLMVLLAGCGGSGGSSLVPNSGGFQRGNFITSTVDVEQQFLYTLNRDNTVSASVVSDEEEEHAHGEHAHGDHAHREYVLREQAHGDDDHDHAHDDEEHDHGDEDHEHSESELLLRPLDGSPYTLSSTPLVDLAVSGDGTSLFLLESDGGLLQFAIDGLSGLLTPAPRIETNITGARLLKVSEDGRAVAVLGDQLAIFAINDDSLSEPAVLEQTENWSDVAVSGTIGVGATADGAVGFSWSPDTFVSLSPAVSLPGTTRGQVAYAAERAYVLNSEDNSISSLDQERNSTLTLAATSSVDAALDDPDLLVATDNQNQLVAADDDTVATFDIDADILTIGSSTEVEQAPTRLFTIVDTALILVGHSVGSGYTALTVDEDGELEIAAEADPDEPGVVSFGYASRNERVTRTVEI